MHLAASQTEALRKALGLSLGVGVGLGVGFAWTVYKTEDLGLADTNSPLSSAGSLAVLLQEFSEPSMCGRKCKLQGHVFEGHGAQAGCAAEGGRCPQPAKGCVIILLAY